MGQRRLHRCDPGTRKVNSRALPPSRDSRFERRHELVERVLRANILDGHLPRGLVLLEAPIATLLQTSRAPVQKALQQLEQDGLVHRFRGRGFVVGRSGGAVEPRRADLRRLGLRVPGEVDEALQSRGSWERIALEVERTVASCLIFGEFRIVETELAHHFSVSRTVVRDLLGRLHERGLLNKNQSSHWIAGPLTAQTIKERYELRRILEPAALMSAAPRLAREPLERLRAEAAGWENGVQNGAGAEAFERRFVQLCILPAPNTQLVEAIRQNLMPLAAASRSLEQLGLPHDDAALSETRMAIELLLNGSIRAASEWWSDHLAAGSQRSIAQLKIVAIIDRPQSFAPYLNPV